MVDGYDGKQQVGGLATEDFYTLAGRSLAPDGVLVVNLWSSDRKYDVYLQRIERCFEFVVTLPAERRGNVAVLAFRRPPGELRWTKLRDKARELELRYGLGFIAMLGAIREFNPSSDKELRI
jgi:spermidine synthase